MYAINEKLLMNTEKYSNLKKAFEDKIKNLDNTLILITEEKKNLTS